MFVEYGCCCSEDVVVDDENEDILPESTAVIYTIQPTCNLVERIPQDRGHGHEPPCFPRRKGL